MAIDREMSRQTLIFVGFLTLKTWSLGGLTRGRGHEGKRGDEHDHSIVDASMKMSE